MIITDSEGNELTTSDGPGGNVGCPVTEDERAWFIEMLKSTAIRVTPEERAQVEAALAKYAETLK